jgi:hypothetical protein
LTPELINSLEIKHKMSSEGPYGRQGFQSNPSGYGSTGGGSYTQQPVYGYGGAAGVPGGGGYGAPPPPPSSGGYDYNNAYGSAVDVSSYEVCICRQKRHRHHSNFAVMIISLESFWFVFKHEFLLLYFN